METRERSEFCWMLSYDECGDVWSTYWTNMNCFKMWSRGWAQLADLYLLWLLRREWQHHILKSPTNVYLITEYIYKILFMKLRTVMRYLEHAREQHVNYLWYTVCFKHIKHIKTYINILQNHSYSYAVLWGFKLMLGFKSNNKLCISQSSVRLLGML